MLRLQRREAQFEVGDVTIENESSIQVQDIVTTDELARSHQRCGPAVEARLLLHAGLGPTNFRGDMKLNLDERPAVELRLIDVKGTSAGVATVGADLRPPGGWPQPAESAHKAHLKIEADAT